MFELIHMQLLFYLSKEGDVYVLIKKKWLKNKENHFSYGALFVQGCHNPLQMVRRAETRKTSKTWYK